MTSHNLFGRTLETFLNQTYCVFYIFVQNLILTISTVSLSTLSILFVDSQLHKSVVTIS